ncbi:MAG: cold-shock protein [Nitrospiraceae bacterium]|nr:MAG: cold-shock protein [Nitrospiraceae bacterium]
MAKSRYETGIVKWYDDFKGCGIILCDRGGEVDVHYSAILCGDGDCVLKEGNRVQFIIFKGLKGPQAQDVMVMDE